MVGWMESGIASPQDRTYDVMRMKCPHCLVSFHAKDDRRHFRPLPLDADPMGNWWVDRESCPDCEKLTIWLIVSAGESDYHPGRNASPTGEWHKVMVYPKGTNRPPVPPEVSDGFAEDYREACLIIADSPKASAALSRRCLQHILREKAGVQHPNDLARAIQEVVDNPAIPSEVSATLDMVRNIGNFSHIRTRA